MTDIGQTVKDATRRLKAFTANNDFEISQGLVNELGEIYEAHTNHDENGQTKIVHAFDSEDGAGMSRQDAAYMTYTVKICVV